MSSLMEYNDGLRTSFSRDAQESNNVVALIGHVRRIVNIANGGTSKSFRRVGSNAMYPRAEVFFKCRKDFARRDIPWKVDIGYHYTSKANMSLICENGLLSKRERDTKVGTPSKIHGARFGDGIYTADNPEAFKDYGDGGIIVFRLQGTSHRMSKSGYHMNKAIGEGVEFEATTKTFRIVESSQSSAITNVNTIIGNRHVTQDEYGSVTWPDSRYFNEVILTTTDQCLPLIAYNKELVNEVGGVQRITEVANSLQLILDELINTPSQVRMKVERKIRSNSFDSEAAVCARSPAAYRKRKSDSYSRKKPCHHQTSYANSRSIVRSQHTAQGIPQIEASDTDRAVAGNPDEFIPDAKPTAAKYKPDPPSLNESSFLGSKAAAVASALGAAQHVTFAFSEKTQQLSWNNLVAAADSHPQQPQHNPFLIPSPPPPDTNHLVAPKVKPLFSLGWATSLASPNAATSQMAANNQAPPTVDYKSLLTKFLQDHHPRRLSEVDSLLFKHMGREEEMFRGLAVEYGKPNPLGDTAESGSTPAGQSLFPRPVAPYPPLSDAPPTAISHIPTIPAPATSFAQGSSGTNPLSFRHLSDACKSTSAGNKRYHDDSYDLQTSKRRKFDAHSSFSRDQAPASFSSLAQTSHFGGQQWIPQPGAMASIHAASSMISPPVHAAAPSANVQSFNLSNQASTGPSSLSAGYFSQQSQPDGTVPYQPTVKQDGSNSIVLQSITAMREHEDKSFEELRLGDYTAGNKGKLANVAIVHFNSVRSIATAPSAIVPSFNLGNQASTGSYDPSSNTTGYFNQQSQTDGTAMVPYQPTVKQDGSNSIVLQSITAMPEYEKKSFEELRLDNYMQGNQGTLAEVAVVHFNTVGTTLPPYHETKRPDGANSSSSFHSITAMPEYEMKSFEELRLEDYTSGNKGLMVSCEAGGFGASSTSVSEQHTPFVFQPFELSYHAPNTFGVPSNAFATTLPPFKATDTCVICQDDLCNEPCSALVSCQHVFHSECIERALKAKRVCPVCRVPINAPPQGYSPSGTMKVSLRNELTCAGYGAGSIVVYYNMPAATQKEYHDHPGAQHSGKKVTAYLPNNSDGLDLLKRLAYAFMHGLTFSVGTSVTTGQCNAVTWASVHHKTSPNCGVRQHGFPDSNYFVNCNTELDNCGVPPASSLSMSGVEVVDLV